ncbi:MAG: hypothetical protein AAF699_16230 [Pseudomonadota bacterium]
MIKQYLMSAVLGVCSANVVAEDCLSVLGTYLTTKTDTSGIDKGMVGRTILSLAPGGFATMTDSAQGGIQGYQAFGMMQGSWNCSTGQDERTAVAVTLLDFSYPSEANPNAKVALVSIAGSVDAETGDIRGKTGVRLYPIDIDPFSNTKPDLEVGYTFEGRRLPNP